MACELLTPTQAQEMWAPMQTEDLLGGIWLPGRRQGEPDRPDRVAGQGRPARGRDGSASASGCSASTWSTAAGGRRVTGVRTDQGDVEAEVVVNCAGQWAKALGDQVGVPIPLHSAEHFYVVTEEIEGVHPDLPIMRDPDGYTYFKEEVGGLVVGGFEPEAKPWVAPDEIPYPFEFQLLDEDWEHFSVLMESAMHRIPALEEAGIRKFYNGPESFTPDNQFLLGEAPGLRRLLRRGRLQLRRHRLRRGRRAGAGRVDRRGRAGRRPAGGRRPSVRAVPRPTTGGCASGSSEVLGRALRHRLAEPGADQRATVPDLAAARPAGATAAPTSDPRWAGSGPTTSPRPVSTAR